MVKVTNLQSTEFDFSFRLRDAVIETTMTNDPLPYHKVHTRLGFGFSDLTV